MLRVTEINACCGRQFFVKRKHIWNSASSAVKEGKVHGIIHAYILIFYAKSCNDTLFLYQLLRYNIYMYSFSRCREPGCAHFAVSDIDNNGNLIESADFCYAHTADKDALQKKIYSYIETHDKIVGLNASGLTFANIDLTNKRFYGCDFSNCLFSGIKTSGLRVRLTNFSYSVFADCNFLKSNVLFSSYAGAKFSHVIFTGSDMVQNNFCGISSFQSSFDDSDLYSSYFINAKLIDTSFRNCNIKETVFYEITQQNVSFRQSNTNAAIFDKRGSALFTGLQELDVPQGVQKGPSL